MITHVVLFWTDHPAESNRAVLLEGARRLGEIPGVLNFHCGVPEPSPRGAVDDSFTVAITMDFESSEALEVYQEHPVHREFLATTFKDTCKRFVVYDIAS